MLADHILHSLEMSLASSTAPTPSPSYTVCCCNPSRCLWSFHSCIEQQLPLFFHPFQSHQWRLWCLSCVRATPSKIPKQVSCRLYKNSGSGEMRFMGWLWSDTIRNGKGWLVEIGASHQIWWNILREHNWGVPSAHIKFIYYVTYILECLIVLRGRVRTGVYTIL